MSGKEKVAWGKGGVVWRKAEPMCRNELVMYGKERETSGKGEVVWWKTGPMPGMNR